MANEESPPSAHQRPASARSHDSRPGDEARANEGAARRTVVCDDALSWLPQHTPLRHSSIITSLPDVSSFPAWSLLEWKRWFTHAATLCLSATPDEGVCIFYQTDIKHEGVWVDKGYLCQRAAEACDMTLRWHKIVCRREAGKPVFGRPGYSHLLCFAKTPLVQTMPAYPDVLPVTGHMTWSQAMGLEACQMACDYVRSHTSSRTIVDPFCGYGSVLAVANYVGLDAFGVEIAHKRARKARNLVLPGHAKRAEGATDARGS